MHDANTFSVRMVGHIVNQPLQLRLPIAGTQVRFLETALRGRFADSSIGNAAKRHGPLGNRVGLLQNVSRDGVEQFMKLNEIRALHIPMGPLDLAV